MNYIDNLKIIEENSEFDNNNNKIVNEYYFHKLAEDLNTLFAKRIVNCQREQLKEKEVLSYSEYKEKWFEKKEGIIYFDKLTTEFVDVNVILNKYQEYCQRF